MARNLGTAEGKLANTRRKEQWVSGIAAGSIATFIMIICGMIVAAAKGMGAATPLKLTAGVFLGADALAAGGSAVFWGLVIQFVVGALLGVVFAYLLPEDATAGSDVMAGLAYGAALYFIMTYLILPWANPLMYQNMPRGWSFLLHLIFGATLALVLPIRRKVHARFVRGAAAHV